MKPVLGFKDKKYTRHAQLIPDIYRGNQQNSKTHRKAIFRTNEIRIFLAENYYGCIFYQKCLRIKKMCGVYPVSLRIG